MAITAALATLCASLCAAASLHLLTVPATMHAAGELATAATAFDAIAFAATAWSWSADYQSRQARLEGCSEAHSGRQVGGLRPACGCSGTGAV